MRLKTDENLHDEVAELLIAEGHDVETIHDEGLRGAHDQTIAQRCQAEGRAIVTLDLDFADVRAFPPAGSAGIIVLRIHDQKSQSSPKRDSGRFAVNAHQVDHRIAVDSV